MLFALKLDGGTSSVASTAPDDMAAKRATVVPAKIMSYWPGLTPLGISVCSR